MAPTLAEEFDQAVAAIRHGRDALDAMSEALLRAARAAWPNRWTEIVPAPVILTSWVGYDTDGRTDIGWWDTLRLRLHMKRLQLARFRSQADAVAEGAPAAAAPRGARSGGGAACRRADRRRRRPGFRLRPRADRGARKHSSGRSAGRGVHGGDRRRAGGATATAGRCTCGPAFAHGLALAHTHVRLNASQIHNAVRQRLGLADPPEDPSRRRVLLGRSTRRWMGPAGAGRFRFGARRGRIGDAADDDSRPAAETHRYRDPVRFLIAETESGYTLLAALWLARLFSIERKIEISPLFETAEALEAGVHVLEEALRSPHWRAYLRTTGRLALQFGYSDSGRYIGPLPPAYFIERCA